MKRISQQWWKGEDGYYLEVAKKQFKGPFEHMIETQGEQDEQDHRDERNSAPSEDARS